MSKKKNVVASVKGRLLEIAREEGRNHQLLLLRYFQERFLYRLSQSKYQSKFCLKGGAFLYAIEGQKSRVTKDIDFLGLRLSSNQDQIKAVLQEICKIPYQEDGVDFNISSLTTEEIVKDGRYQGIRVGLTGFLDKTKQQLQIDIGFGDIVIPNPVLMTYPVILEMDPPELLAYSIESTIAEKFEAMIDLGEINTRMKDFYDIYQLLLKQKTKFNLLRQAIFETFKQRETPCPKTHIIFQETFSEDISRNRHWKVWLRKTKLDEKLEFSDVMQMIKEHLEPIYNELSLR
ncbi:MAG: nucleotidyl transferase AbiEii/AbiGii toxin family protein [Bacteroidota bacterium]